MIFKENVRSASGRFKAVCKVQEVSSLDLKLVAKMDFLKLNFDG